MIQRAKHLNAITAISLLSTCYAWMFWISFNNLLLYWHSFSPPSHHIIYGTDAIPYINIISISVLFFGIVGLIFTEKRYYSIVLIFFGILFYPHNRLEGIVYKNWDGYGVIGIKIIYILSWIALGYFNAKAIWYTEGFFTKKDDKNGTRLIDFIKRETKYPLFWVHILTGILIILSIFFLFKFIPFWVEGK